jgi:hypothetical protein
VEADLEIPLTESVQVIGLCVGVVESVSDKHRESCTVPEEGRCRTISKSSLSTDCMFCTPSYLRLR